MHCSLVGAIVVVVGFYAVVWGKAKEGTTIEKVEGSKSSESNGKRMPLLHSYSEEDGEVRPQVA